MLLAMLMACGPLSVAAGGDLVFDEAVRISLSDGEAATKAKLVRQEYATEQGLETALVVIYADGVGPGVRIYDGSEHAAGDVFVSRSVDDGSSWSAPLNLSRSAHLSSIMVDHDGDPQTPPRPFYGDSIKPMIFGTGPDLAVAWLDAFCPTTEQRTVSYELEDGSGLVEVAYYAVYVVRSTDGGRTWSEPERLTTAYRDARQCFVRASGAGWLVVWQADPRGLQPGEGLGCGPGGSGAKVSPGTDIWFTALATAEFRGGAPFAAPRRVTDNFTKIDGDPEQDGYESGSTGASRPTIMLKNDTAIIAYEESKGVGTKGAGKFVRYHVFSMLDDEDPDPTQGAGWIVSDPRQNARRARLVPAGPPAGETDLRMCLLFRQGRGSHAASAGIAVRVAHGGVLPENLYPEVAPDPTTYRAALASAPPVLLSMVDEWLEPINAWAHRAIVVGDGIVAGFCQTPPDAPDQRVIGADFFVRRSQDGGMTWEPATNLSRMASSSVTVLEPRIIKTPGSAEPGERDPNVLYASWGTQALTPTPDGEAGPHLDIYLTRSADLGATYLAPELLAGGPDAELESQIRCTADGRRVFGVWQRDTEARSAIYFRSGEATDVLRADLDGDGLVNEADLALMCRDWGTGGGGDLDGDGRSGPHDVLLLLDAWSVGVD